ncbi:MAG TPA: hypothetical protein VIA62_22125 [Thermoanaerobaculia bacterium]|jgi:hypothetical protein|nr:hypothetical protein [Thermoanaerobaculia bacterium]
MFSKSVFRGVVVVLIVALFLIPAVAQAGGRSTLRSGSKPAASRVQEPGGVLQALWHGLVSLFEKEGASIDPSGQPVTGTATPTPGAGTGDEGASIDPNGTH